MLMHLNFIVDSYNIIIITVIIIITANTLDSCMHSHIQCIGSSKLATKCGNIFLHMHVYEVSQIQHHC